jgi:O-antigen/teichoic acid export membrane protein
VGHEPPSQAGAEEGAGRASPCAPLAAALSTEIGEPPAEALAVSIDTSARRFGYNAVANVAYLVFNAAVQLWFTRYLVHNLGVAAYGLVPLAVTVTNYMTILTMSLSGSVGRFLTIDLAQGDVPSATRTFNTSLFSSIILAVALTPVAGAIAWFSPDILSIPEGHEAGTRILLSCTGFAFLLNAAGSSFACAAFVKNRFEVERLIDFLGQTAQVACVVVLFRFYAVNLTSVGLGIVLLAMVRQVGYQVVWRKLVGEVPIRLSAYDGTRLREVLSMGGWMVVANVGGLLLAQSDLVIANVVVGPEPAGFYAPIVQIAVLIRALAGAASKAVSPTMAVAHGRGESERLARLAVRSVRWLGLFVALPAGLIAGLSKDLLSLWLGSDFASMAPFVMVLVIGAAVNVASMPCNSLYQAMDRVKWHGLTMVLAGVLYIGLGVWTAGPLGWGLWGVALSGVFVMTLKSSVWMPWYAAILLRTSVWPYFAALLLCAVCTSLLCGASYLMVHWVTDSVGLGALPALLVTGVACGAPYALALLVGLRREARRGEMAGAAAPAAGPEDASSVASNP